MNLLFWLLGHEKTFLLQRFMIFHENYKFEKNKKKLFEIILFLKINYNQILTEFENFKPLFKEILILLNEYYDLIDEEIEQLLFLDDIILDCIDEKLLEIQYYTNYITKLPEKFLIIYSNLETTKSSTIEFISQYGYYGHKIIQIIKKYSNKI